MPERGEVRARPSGRPESPVRSELLLTDGARLPYASFGRGEKVLVYLPGISLKSPVETADPLTYAYRDLAEDFRIFVFDRRDPLPEGFGLSAMAEDVIAALSALGIRRAVIHGISQGGLLAQEIAARCPELVEGLVLGSTLHHVYPAFLETTEKWQSMAKGRDRQGLANDLYGPDLVPEKGSL